MLAAAIGSEVVGSLSLKAAIDQPWYYFVVAVGYVASFVFITISLRAGMGLGVAYGIWGALGVALVAVLSIGLFSEPLTFGQILGLGVIVAGVLVVQLGSQRAIGHRANSNASTD